jgi:predicted GH43/DUF377 family glycosyl hydrolase
MICLAVCLVILVTGGRAVCEEGGTMSPRADKPTYLQRFRVAKPVLLPGTREESTDSDAVECPKVVFWEGKYYMFHTAIAREEGTRRERIALAASDDLVHWRKEGVVLDVGEEGAFDYGGLSAPFPYRDGNTWVLFYVGFSEKGYEAGRSGINFARSSDLRNWEKHPGGPVLTTSAGDEWDSRTVYQCFVTRYPDEPEGPHWMFYNAARKDGHEQIGLATSEDLIHWQRHPENPLLRFDTMGLSERNGNVADPWIVRPEGLWHMFYFAFDGEHARDLVATSADWIHWELSPHNPVLDAGPPGSYDCVHAHKPCLIEKDGVWYHFYTSVGVYGESQWVRAIALATSERLTGVEYRE